MGDSLADSLQRMASSQFAGIPYSRGIREEHVCCFHSGFGYASVTIPATHVPQRGREVSVCKLQCFGEELLVPSGALSLSLEAVGGGMMP